MVFLTYEYGFLHTTASRPIAGLLVEIRRGMRPPRTKRFYAGGGFYPVYLTDKTIYLPTMVYGSSHP
jgi:hypothetical protein